MWIAIGREPRVDVLIDEEARRHRRVQMTATAAVVEGPTTRADRSEGWRQLGQLLSARYMADEQGQAYAELTAERPRFLVEITPLQIVLGIRTGVRGDDNREASLQILAQQLVERLEEPVRQRLAGSVRVLYEVGQRHIQQVEPHAAVDSEPNFQRIRAQVPVIDTWRWAADERGQAVDPNSGSQNSAARSALTDGTPPAASRRRNLSFADTANTIAPARARQA